MKYLPLVVNKQQESQTDELKKGNTFMIIMRDDIIFEPILFKPIKSALRFLQVLRN
jgi:hypothetical protein